MDYISILTYKKIYNYTSNNINDYDTYIFNNQEKPTIEDINNWNIEYNKFLCKSEAKKRIAEYDWINDDTTTPQLLNKEDFYAYRSALRELILNPVENPVFPPIPEEVWDAS